MSIRRIEMELEVVGTEIAKHHTAIVDLEKWAEELRTSLRVMQRLTASHLTDPAIVDSPVDSSAVGVAGADRPNSLQRQSGERPQATGKVLEAGEALKKLIRGRGAFVRPMDAVVCLKDAWGIQIGLGKPGRETSDLSAALGHGRVPGLVVIRGLGWGLAEWNGLNPGSPDSDAASTADDPTDHDLIRDEIALHKGSEERSEEAGGGQPR